MSVRKTVGVYERPATPSRWPRIALMVMVVILVILAAAFAPRLMGADIQAEVSDTTILIGKYGLASR